MAVNKGNTKASNTCLYSSMVEKGNNVCSYKATDMCIEWNNAYIYTGDEEPKTCSSDLNGIYLKNSENLYYCNAGESTSQIKSIQDTATIKKDCKGSAEYLKGDSTWNFCNPLSYNELFDPNINQSTEYNTLQNNRLNIQQKYLDSVQKEIASKDSVIDMYRETNNNKIKTVKVLKIFFIFLFIFFFALLAHSLRKIDNTILGLIFTTLIVSYIYYIVWTFNSDKIPEYVKHDTNIIKNSFKSDNNNENCKEEDQDENGNCMINSNNNTDTQDQYIKDNCDCPPEPEEEEDTSHLPECKPIETNQGTFYYDHSSPKQRLYPKVNKEDSKYLEYIEWEKDSSSNKLQWDWNNGEYRKYADPNYELKNDINVAEENKYWTLDL